MVLRAPAAGQKDNRYNNIKDRRDVGAIYVGTYWNVRSLTNERSSHVQPNWRVDLLRKVQPCILKHEIDHIYPSIS